MNGKTIGSLVEDQHEDIELRYPLLRLREAGAEVGVVALSIAWLLSSSARPICTNTSTSSNRALAL